MANDKPVASPGKSSIGNERDFLTHALTVNNGGWSEHFPHSRPTLRTLVADDDDVPFPVLLTPNNRHAVLFAFKYKGGAFMHQPGKTRHFDQSTIRGEVSLQHNNTAGG